MPTTARGRATKREPAVQARALWSIGLLLAVPAVFLPGGLERFTFAKLAVAAVGIALAFSVPAVGRLGKVGGGLLAAAGAVTLLAAFVSASPVVSLLGRGPRYQGLAVGLIYLLALLAGVRLLGPGRPRRHVLVALGTMSWVSIAVAAVAVLEVFGVQLLSTDLARSGSLLGNASDQGAFGVLFSGPLVVAALRHRRALYLVGAGAAAAAAVVSASRGALVGLVAVIVLLAVVAGRRYWRQIALGTAAAIGVALAIPLTRDRMLGLSPLAGQTITGRRLLWGESLQLIGDHPLLGVGPNQFRQALVRYHDLRWQQTIGPKNPPAEPHNLVLQILAVGGALLLASALALAVLLALRAWAQWRAAGPIPPAVSRRRSPSAQTPGDDAILWVTGSAAGLLGYIVALQFHVLSPPVTISAAMLAGSLLALPLVTSAAEVRPAVAAGTVARTVVGRAARLVTVGLAGVLAVIFAAGAVGEIYLAKAESAIGAGDFEAGDNAYRAAERLRPWDLELAGHAMTSYLGWAAAGDPATDPVVAEAGDFAQQWADRLGTLANDEQWAYNIAALQQARGEFDSAATRLDELLATDPHNPQLLTLRGVVHAQLGEYDEALDMFTAATAVDPTDPKPWGNIAIVQMNLGNTEAAEAARRTADELAAEGN